MRTPTEIRLAIVELESSLELGRPHHVSFFHSILGRGELGDARGVQLAVRALHTVYGRRGGETLSRCEVNTAVFIVERWLVRGGNGKRVRQWLCDTGGLTVAKRYGADMLSALRWVLSEGGHGNQA